MQLETVIAVFVFLILTISNTVVILGLIHAIDNMLHIVNKRTLSRKMKHVKFTRTCLFLQDPEGPLIGFPAVNNHTQLK